MRFHAALAIHDIAIRIEDFSKNRFGFKHGSARVRLMSFFNE